MSSAKSHIQEEIDRHIKPQHDIAEHQLLLVHKKTGEVVEVAEVINEDAEIIRARSQEAVRSKLYFYVTLQAREKELSKTLSSDAFRILGFLRSSIQANNRVHNMANIDISKELNIGYAKVGKAIKELITKKVVHFRIEKRNRTYYIDPTLCFKGNFYRQQRMMKEYAKLFEDE